MDQLINLKDLLVEQVQSIYASQKVQDKKMPKLQQQITSADLRVAVNDRIQSSQQQRQRLESALQQLNASPKKMDHECMDTLLDEAKGYTKRCADGQVCDAALTNAIQHVLHYDIASYGSACAFAKALAMDDVAVLLHQNLEEEKQLDTRLSQLAEEHINRDAKAPII